MQTIKEGNNEMTRTNTRVVVAALAVAVYISCVVLANWLTTHYGFVGVGFGHMATAGTFAAGGALVVRDVVQDAVGRFGVLALIVIAATLSYLIASPAIAAASGAAFIVSEMLDMAAYTPLRRRGRFGGNWWRLAVAVGALVGAIADTIVFLWIAFGWDTIRPALTGQLLGKLEVAVALIIVGSLARALLREPLDAPRS